ncbi:MAG: hypothetical protein AAGH15_04435 [Myxococcota bacterium]
MENATATLDRSNYGSGRSVPPRPALGLPSHAARLESLCRLLEDKAQDFARCGGLDGLAAEAIPPGGGLRAVRAALTYMLENIDPEVSDPGDQILTPPRMAHSALSYPPMQRDQALAVLAPEFEKTDMYLPILKCIEAATCFTKHAMFREDFAKLFRNLVFTWRLDPEALYEAVTR